MRSNNTWLRCKTIDLNRNSTCWNIKQNGNKETNVNMKNRKNSQQKKQNLVHKQCKFNIFNGFRCTIARFTSATSHESNAWAHALNDRPQTTYHNECECEKKQIANINAFSLHLKYSIYAHKSVYCVCVLHGFFSHFFPFAIIRHITSSSHQHLSTDQDCFLFVCFTLGIAT